MSGTGKGSLSQWWSSLKKLKLPKLTSSQPVYTYLPLMGLITCLISSSHSSPINRQAGISENVYITFQNDTSGVEQRVCSIDSMTYEDGESIPTSSACEHCICRPPGFACTIISCEYRPGCKAIKRSNQCCPEYQCECEKDGKIYQNGEKILDDNNPCEVCYCQGGDVICAVIDCYWRSDCQPRYIENRCCPLYDHCPPPSDLGPIRPTHRPTTTTTVSTPISWFNLSSSIYATPSTTKKPLLQITTELAPVHVPEVAPSAQPVEAAVLPQEIPANEQEIVILEVPVPASEQQELVPPQASDKVSEAVEAQIPVEHVSQSVPLPVLVDNTQVVQAAAPAQIQQNAPASIAAGLEEGSAPQESHQSNVSEGVAEVAHQESPQQPGASQENLIPELVHPIPIESSVSETVPAPVVPESVSTDSEPTKVQEAAPSAIPSPASQTGVSVAEVLPEVPPVPQKPISNAEVVLQQELADAVAQPSTEVSVSKEPEAVNIPNKIVEGVQSAEASEASTDQSISQDHVGAQDLAEIVTRKANASSISPEVVPVSQHSTDRPNSEADIPILAQELANLQGIVAQESHQTFTPSAEVAIPEGVSNPSAAPITDAETSNQNPVNSESVVPLVPAEGQGNVILEESQKEPISGLVLDAVLQESPESQVVQASPAQVQGNPIPPSASISQESPIPAVDDVVGASLPEIQPSAQQPVGLPASEVADSTSDSHSASEKVSSSPAENAKPEAVVVEIPTETPHSDQSVPILPEPVNPQVSIVVVGDASSSEDSQNTQLPAEQEVPVSLPQDFVNSVSQEVPVSIPEDASVLPISEPVVPPTQDAVFQPAAESIPPVQITAAQVDKIAPQEESPAPVVVQELSPVKPESSRPNEIVSELHDSVILVTPSEASPVGSSVGSAQTPAESAVVPEQVIESVSQDAAAPEQYPVSAQEKVPDPAVVEIFPEQNIVVEIPIADQKVSEPKQPESVLIIVNEPKPIESEIPQTETIQITETAQPEQPIFVEVKEPIIEILPSQPIYLEPVFTPLVPDESKVPLEMLLKPADYEILPATSALFDPTVAFPLPDNGNVAIDVLNTPFTSDVPLISSSLQTEILPVTYPFADGPFTPAEIITVTPTKSFGSFATTLPTYTIAHSESSAILVQASQTESEILPSTTIIVVEPSKLVISEIPVELPVPGAVEPNISVEVTTQSVLVANTVEPVNSPASASQEVLVEIVEEVVESTSASSESSENSGIVSTAAQPVEPVLPTVSPTSGEIKVQDSAVSTQTAVKEAPAGIEEPSIVSDDVVEDEPVTQSPHDQANKIVEASAPTTVVPELSPVQPTEIILPVALTATFGESFAAAVQVVESTTDAPMEVVPVAVQVDVVDILKPSQHLEMPVHEFAQNEISDTENEKPLGDEAIEVIQPEQEMVPPVIMSHTKLEEDKVNVAADSKPGVTENIKNVIIEPDTGDQSVSFSSDEAVPVVDKAADDKIPVIIVDIDTGNTELPMSFDSFLTNAQILAHIPGLPSGSKVESIEEVPAPTPAPPLGITVQDEIVHDEPAVVTEANLPEQKVQDVVASVVPINPEPQSTSHPEVSLNDGVTVKDEVPEPIVESESLADDLLVENQEAPTIQLSKVEPSQEPISQHENAEIIFDDTGVTESSTDAPKSEHSVSTKLHVALNEPPKALESVPIQDDQAPVFDDKPGNDPEIPEATASSIKTENNAEVFLDDVDALATESNINEFSTVQPQLAQSDKSKVSNTGIQGVVEAQHDEPEQGPIPNDHEYHSIEKTTTHPKIIADVEASSDLNEEVTNSPAQSNPADSGSQNDDHEATELPISDTPDSKYRLDLSLFEDEDLKEKADVTTSPPFVKLTKVGHKGQEVEVGFKPVQLHQDENEVVFDEPTGTTEVVPQALVHNEIVKEHGFYNDAVEVPTTLPALERLEIEQESESTPFPSANLQRHHIPGHEHEHEEGTTGLAQDEAVTTESPIVLHNREDVLQVNHAAPVKTHLAESVPVNLNNNPTVPALPKLSPKFQIPSELLKKVEPIADDLEDFGRSDLSVRANADNEVSNTDETWFWRAFNRVRTFTGLFPAAPPKSSRKPRSLKSEKAEAENGPLYVTIRGKKVVLKNSGADKPKELKYWAFPRLLLW